MFKIRILIVGICLASVEMMGADGVSKAVRVIVGEGENKGYYGRAREVNQLGRNLPVEDVEALLSFLDKKVNDENLKRLEFNAIKNDIVLALMKQRRFPRKLIPNLIAAYDNEAFDATWRNYALQFLGQLYYKATYDEKKEIRKVLVNSLATNDSAMIATSLTFLSELSKEPDVDKMAVANAALKLATSETEPATLRLTAIQVCAELDDKRILPLARSLATSKAFVPLRMSAIAAIGKLGDQSDLPTLKKLAKSPDYRIRTAAKGAVIKIRINS